MKRATNRLVPFLEGAVWLCFALGVLTAIWPAEVQSVLSMPPYLSIDGLTRVVWPYAALITGIVLRFSSRYMAGNHRMGYFFLRCLLFLLAVMGLSATDHLLVFWFCWAFMGVIMSGLISHKIDWPQARAAGRFALRYFVVGSLFLGVGAGTLYVMTDTLVISEALQQTYLLPEWAVALVFACFLLAAIIQSALFPVQDWLMSSMTAPTPASALMHAGFVNAGGIFLTTFAPLFAKRPGFMILLVGVGALSAFLGKTWKAVQSAVKRQLGCSTVAQMGFMILQCGLGFFSAAITHLMLHGFYKGYLFMNVGNTIDQTARARKKTSTSSAGVLVESLVTAALCAAVFFSITGKGLAFDSGIVLAFVVVFAVMHGSREFVNRLNQSGATRFVLLPLVALVSTALFSIVYVGVTALMADVPLVASALPFNWFHGMVMGVFFVAYVVMETGLHEQFPRLYVYVLNASQPNPDTVVSSREEYHV